MDVTKSRREQLARIHAAARTLGYETRPGHNRCKYETLLEFLIGRSSCKDATPAELALVADALSKRADGRDVVAVKFAPRPTYIVIVTDEEALHILGMAA